MSTITVERVREGIYFRDFVFKYLRTIREPIQENGTASTIIMMAPDTSINLRSVL